MPDAAFNRLTTLQPRRDPGLVRAVALLVVVGGVSLASLLTRPQPSWFWYAICAVYLAVAGASLWAQHRR